MGSVTNIGPYDRLGANVWSVILVIALPSLRHLVIIHLSMALADCDQAINGIHKY